MYLTLKKMKIIVWQRDDTFAKEKNIYTSPKEYAKIGYYCEKYLIVLEQNDFGTRDVRIIDSNGNSLKKIKSLNENENVGTPTSECVYLDDKVIIINLSATNTFYDTATYKFNKDSDFNFSNTVYSKVNVKECNVIEQLINGYYVVEYDNNNYFIDSNGDIIIEYGTVD